MSKINSTQKSRNKNSKNHGIEFYNCLSYTLLCETEEDKAEYLKNLYNETYLDDIKERRNIKNEQLLNDILDVLSSQIGSLTNPTRLTIVNKGAKKYYIQSAYRLTDDEKTNQEKQSLKNINDSFKKIVVVKDNIKTRIDNDGIVTMGLYHFLLNENSLDE